MTGVVAIVALDVVGDLNTSTMSNVSSASGAPTSDRAAVVVAVAVAVVVVVVVV